MKRISSIYMFGIAPVVVAFLLAGLLNFANKKALRRMENLVENAKSIHQELRATEGYTHIDLPVREKSELLLMDFETTLWSFNNLFYGTYQISIAWMLFTVMCFAIQTIVRKRVRQSPEGR